MSIAGKGETLTEQALKDSELRYRRLFETAQDGILILNAETGMIDDVNQYLIKMLGYLRTEFIKKKLWEVGAFKDIEASQDAFEALQKKEYIRYEDLPLKTKDGRLIQVEFVSNVYLVGGEKVIQCNIRNVTEHKRIVAALQENEKTYHDLINQSPDGFFVIASSGNILTVNKAICQALVYSQEELLSMNIWDIIPKKKLDQYKKRLKKILSGKSLSEEAEYIVRGRDGKEHYVEILSAPHYSGKDIVGFQGIARDVTARKQAEEQLRYQATLLANVNDAIVATDAQFRLTTWNAGAEALYGWKAEEVLGKNGIEIVRTEWPSKDADEMRRMITETGLWSGEATQARKDGTRISVEASSVVLHDENGKVSGYVSVNRDITKRKRVEHEIREREKELGTMLGMSIILEREDITQDEIYQELANILPAGWQYPEITCVRIVIDGSEFCTKNFRESAWMQSAPIIVDKSTIGKIEVGYLEKQSDEAEGPFLQEERELINDIAKRMGHQIERKRSENELRELKALFEAVVENIPLMVFLKEAEDLRFVLFNRAGEELLGYDRKMLLNKNDLDLFPPEQADYFVTKDREALDGEAGMVDIPEELIQTARKGQRLLHTRKVRIRGTDGITKYLLGISEDITERKQAEEALRLSEEKYRTLVDEVNDGFYVTDEAGVFTFANSALAEIYGFETPEMLVGRKFMDFIAPEILAELGESIRGTMHTTRVPKVINGPIVRPDGTRAFLEIKSVSISKGNQNVGARGIVRDITVQKRAEEQIQKQLAHLTALSSIDQTIAASLDLKLSLSEILTHVTKELGIDAADILNLNPGLQMLEYVAEHGFRTKAIRERQVRLGESYAGRVALERRLIQIPNLREEPDNLLLTSLLKGEDFVCYYGVPLIAKGQVEGVLEVFHRAALEPDAEWFDFLNTLAGQAAIAIENATLFESLKRSNTELSLAYDATIEGWSRALDLRDKETEGHSQRVTEMAVKLAQAFGFSDVELKQVRWGALLHDIGKLGVPDGILLKPGSLTDEEWIKIKAHPRFAYELLSPIHYLEQALDIPYCHHEKWDGSGYPRGLEGDQIPLAARIFAIVDVWDAVTSDRPYRPAWTKEKTREHILSSSGTHFDPKVVEIFLKLDLETKEKNENEQ